MCEDIVSDDIGTYKSEDLQMERNASIGDMSRYFSMPEMCTEAVAFMLSLFLFVF